MLYKMWEHLDDAGREGTHRWRQTFAFEGPIFSHFFRSDAAMRTFMRGMHGFGRLSSPPVVETFTGHLAIAACERYPGLRGAVFDLPRLMPIAREEVALSAAKPRIELLEGDFFAQDLPVADLYAGCRPLHDWSEEKIAILLEKIYAALPAGGALLVAERLVDDDKTVPSDAAMQSLNMLVRTEARERNRAEYEAPGLTEWRQEEPAGRWARNGMEMNPPGSAVLTAQKR